ncbi:MAG TPA: M48 family metalloprotease [Candidatus Sulfotelmatobacter sp.]|nr:M48 family metalloprotease [Candidatus Sulfotelmatobacter sp.]
MSGYHNHRVAQWSLFFVPYAFWTFRLLAFAFLMPGHWGLLAVLWAGGDCWRRWLPPEGELLRDETLQDMLRRCGLAEAGLWLSDAKAKGKANAGFAGAPWRRRIVFSPALCQGLPFELQTAVLAHEAGHCRLRHEEQWLAGGFFFWMALFALMAAHWGVWPVAALTVAAWVAVRQGRPLLAPLRRRWEFQADAFAAAQVGAEAMAAALERLEEISPPAPSAVVPYHPALQERLARLRSL